MAGRPIVDGFLSKKLKLNSVFTSKCVSKHHTQNKNLNEGANLFITGKCLILCIILLILYCALTYFRQLILPSLTTFSWAILNDIHTAIGWTYVDLVNFKYFKNLPSQDPKRAAQANLFLEHFQKKKAVLDYFENLFLGNSPFTQESEIPFDPHFGRAWRPYYVRKFGWKGERLIDALGKGYSIKQLRHFGAIPKDYGSKYYPS